MTVKKYLTFKHVGSKPKTEVYRVIETEEDSTIGTITSSLGIIKWYAPWRQYCFYPGCNTFFSRNCWKEIFDFIQKLMDERKK